MPESSIKYFGETVRVRCDGKCKKAWGSNTRPKIFLSDDEDDYAYLADQELDIAPIDPLTYEGGIAKPLDVSEFPNKWCIRECERCVRTDFGKPDIDLDLPDFTKRIPNMKWRSQ